jgi:hypothetical protein
LYQGAGGLRRNTIKAGWLHDSIARGRLIRAVGMVKPHGKPVLCCMKAEVHMHLTTALISPLAALIAGVLILLVPRLLNYVVALYLIVVGVAGLNGIYHFVR